MGKYINIASRSAGFVAKRFGGKLGEISADGAALLDTLRAQQEPIQQLYESREFAKALRETMLLADRVNEYVDQNKPWELAKQQGMDTRLHDVCTVCIEAFRVLSVYLKPVLPQLAELYAEQAADAAEDGKTAEAQAGYDRAIAAYARAEHWLRQADELGVTAFAAGSASLRLAKHKLALSAAQFGRGDAAAANQSLLIAGAYSCGAVGENFVARFNAGEPTGPEEWQSYEVCNDVTTAYYVASGQAGKDSMAWYDEQLAILNTDISPELMRAITEAGATRPQ